MKNSTIWIISAVIILIIAAFIFFSANKEDSLAPKDNEVTSSEENNGSSENADTESTPQTEKIDYNETEISLWMKNDGNADELTAKLIAIDTVPYGTAGSSLNMFSAASDMLTLSKEAGAVESLKAYLSSMTDIQKDYFSFQWENVYQAALNILKEPEGSKGFLADSGHEDFDISLYNDKDLEKLFADGRKLLQEMGVKEEWKNFTDIEPFNVNSEMQQFKDI